MANVAASILKYEVEKSNWKRQKKQIPVASRKNKENTNEEYKNILWLDNKI